MDKTHLIDQYFGKYIMLNPQSLQIIAETTDIVSFKKGAQPIEEGRHHNYNYLIIKGAARSFYTKDGIEVTNWFTFEEDSAGTLQNYLGLPARETIEFIEDSDCLRFNIHQFKELQYQYLTISNLICHLLQEHAIFCENRLRMLQFNEGMERYCYILEYEPEILQRVPLTYLASYLGMARETLSRLRRKISI
ncbi:MAG: hypothetical protein AAF806_20920 [Bacteroidota bacterium]